jgi:hypothetical protein
MERLLSRVARMFDARERPSPGPTAAPLALRRRVLASVRSELPAQGRGGPPTAAGGRLPRAHAGALALAALAAAVWLAGWGAGAGLRTVRPARAQAASLRLLGDHAELAISGMVQPPYGEVYEVWLQSAGRAPVATDALFSPSATGSASVEVPGPLRGVRAVIVTPEPLGGSTTPTAPAALSLRVPGAGRGS